MDWLDYGTEFKYGLIALVLAIGAFQRWLVHRKERKTQETIDVFDLVGLYRKIYARAYSSEDERISETAYQDATKNSEAAYRIQMGGHLQQYFSFKQMSAAIAQRHGNAIYDGDDILPGMMKTAREKAEQNVAQIKSSLVRGGPDGQVSTRQRRRR
jgi:hypothetical protein